MKDLLEKLSRLEAMAFTAVEDDADYKRIRADVLDLVAEARIALSPEECAVFKSSVMELLYRICGTHLDLEVLEAYTPAVLSPEELEMIIQKSALARWM